MSPPLLLPARLPWRDRHGVALIIVLAFIVLLTGLTVAFFSLAVGNRQISNSSANGTRADIFAQDATATILGDLSQEIAAGSVQPYPNPSAGSYLYVPTTPAAAVPCLARATVADTPSYLPNVVKRSANSVPFFSGSSYDTTNYPPSNRAAKVSSTAASQNGRVISPARWNQPLLLPKKDPTQDTDFTPAGPSPSISYAPPDWILVARDGTNPAVSTLSAALHTNGTNPVVGRFAYNIYDEGGLLDANVVGFPTDTTVPSPQGNYPAYKKTLAFADLKQLPGFADLPAARQEQIVRTLAGWRNFASTGIDPTVANPVAGSPVGGSLSAGYTWNSSNIVNYFNFINLNGAGFLHAANPLLVNNQSDRLFTSRQTLINLLLNGVANQDPGATAERASLQNSLQYLGTFSRDLNQPSFRPDPSKPLIAAPSAGGNDGNGGDAPSLITATTDRRINPSFLAVRVATAFTRNDGTAAVVGEPLVKTRFALNRLAWLTYQGPSATRNIANPGATGPDADIYSLENSYGVSQALLQQGTNDNTDSTKNNIKKYFGLQWGPNPTNAGQKCWSYVHGSSSNTINTLNQVAQMTGANAREPDFVELLKAAVCAGSIAKPSVLNNTSGTAAYDYQYALDSSTDYAVMQIFANIIGQSSTDGYPPAIYFPVSASTFNGMFYGEKNLPYLSRVRTMVIKAKEPILKGGPLPYGADYSPPWTEAESTTNHYYPPPFKVVPLTTYIADTGVGLAMLYPELWNPHDWNPNSVNQTLGNPRPTSFEVTAESDVNQSNIALIATDHGPSPLPGTINAVTAGTSQSNSNGIDVGNSPGFASRGFAFQSGVGRYLKESDTAMTFSLPGDTTDSTFFREPTMLFKPGVPSGSNLNGTGLATLTASAPLNQFRASGGGLMSGVTSGSVPYANGDPALMDMPTQGYIGFYLGAFPLWWCADFKDKDPQSPTNGQTVPIAYTAAVVANVGSINGASGNTVSVPSNITYRVKCQDASGQWTPYDQKYGDLNPNIASGALMLDRYEGFFNPQGRGMPYAMTVDPRSSRFGLINAINPEINTGGAAPSPKDYFPPFVPGSGDTVGWLNRANAIICAQRMGQSAGATLWIYPSGFVAPLGPNSTSYDKTWNDWWMTPTLGWYPGSAGAFLDTSKIAKSLRPGLLTQNNPSVLNDGMAYDGAPQSSNPVSQYYADADGIVRRAMAAYILGSGSSSSATTLTGLPMATANSGGTKWTAQSQSRPMILNRPFSSVAELGYVFTGTPWKNIDFSTPESGAAALLDVFCLNDTDNSAGLVAGKVNLNTRQVPVLQAILAGAYKDETNPATATIPGSLAQTVAQGLVTRTGSKGPLVNPSELVGKWVSSVAASGGGIDGSKSYDGFSADLSTLLPSGTDQNVQRFREATIRALANSGQTRLWNLMIDCVAQVGRYPASASLLSQFNVEGEQRFWVHVSIDRLTGQVVDKQIEIVKE